MAGVIHSPYMHTTQFRNEQICTRFFNFSPSRTELGGTENASR